MSVCPFSLSFEHLLSILEFSPFQVGHAIFIRVSYKRLVRLFFKIYSFIRNCTAWSEKMCFLYLGFYCTHARHQSFNEDLSSNIFQIGGSKAGCFHSYPSHSEDPYVVIKNAFRTGNAGEKKIFRPSQGPKSCPTKSVISQNVEK